MIEVFKTYAKAGLACLPTKEDKSPDVKDTWKGGIKDSKAYQNAHGIGIICGKLSHGLECMDFDNHFADAKDTLSSFIRIPEVKEIYEHYQLPIQATQSGGYHLLYRCSVVEGNQKLAQRPKKEGDTWKPDTIIETRGEGGYFCAAPTLGYRVIRNSIKDIQEITPDERELLISLAKTYNTWDNTRKTEFQDKGRPGEIYDNQPEAIDEMKSALLDTGWKELREGLWRRPGKDKGISATLGKVAPNVFYCFTSNGHPFQQNSGYTPFQIVGLLKYNGDFSALAKYLSVKYKVESPVKSDYKPSSQKEPKSFEEYEKILNDSFIDFMIPVEKPPVVIMFRDRQRGIQQAFDKRVFTLGNFSCITGKSKSKKTFLTSLLMASAAGNEIIGSKIIAEFPDNKRAVLLFDTEQSRYDAYIAASRIPKLLGYNPENFGAFDLREFNPLERCRIIEYSLEKWKENLGMVVIDGIADLATAINDEEEASRVVSLLMRWTKVYNCHIVVVIHQNKYNEFATGHLGSSVMKKAETIIAVTKDEEMYSRSHISCNMIRGAADFNDFTIEVDERGLPRVLSDVEQKKVEQSWVDLEKE
jgi:hypothetical protein